MLLLVKFGREISCAESFFEQRTILKLVVSFFVPISYVNSSLEFIFKPFFQSLALDQSPVKGCISTFVLHHRTNPEWYSEVKIALPVALDPRLHLLFQFYHISCSFDKATKSKQVENVIGYAWGK